MAFDISAFENSETIGTTEHSLTTDTSGPDVDTTAGVFQPFLDLNALAAGDVFEFTTYATVASSDGTQRKVYTAQFSGVQDTPIWAGPAIPLGIGWDMTMKKVSGTDRSIVWRIVQVV